MSPLLATIIRVVFLGVVASFAGFMAVWVDFPIKVHSLLLGGGAVLFAVTEGFFRSLISEFNSIYRRGGYSLWQMEKLEQVIPPLRKRVWQLWNLSLWIKGIVAILAVGLQYDGIKPEWVNYFIFLGYALLITTFFLSWWAQSTFKRMEEFCDRVAVLEVEIKENKRLKAEMLAGKPHDFASDENLSSYSKSPNIPG